MMSFLQTIKNAIYSPPFYAQIPQKPFTSGLIYYFLLAVFLTFFQSLFALPQIITLQNKAPEYINSAIKSYPKELEVKIKNGQTSTNVEEPYKILFPKNLRSNSIDGQSQSTNLIVIDTKTPFSTTQFHKYDTEAWLTKDKIAYKNNNRVAVSELSDMQNMTISQKTLRELLKKIQPWFSVIIPLLFILSFLVVILFQVLRLLYMTLLAVLIWSIGKATGKKLDYKNAYKIGLYAATAGLLLEFFVTLTMPFLHIHGFPFMFSIVTLAIVIINFVSFAKETKIIPAKKPKSTR